MLNFPDGRSVMRWALGCLLLVFSPGCGDAEPQPLPIETDQSVSIAPNVPYLLPAYTQLKATGQCVISFPGEGLFEPGDVIGEVVVIDNDALMELAPHNEKVSVILQAGQSMLITKPRTITVEESATTPCRFEVTSSTGG